MERMQPGGLLVRRGAHFWLVNQARGRSSSRAHSSFTWEGLNIGVGAIVRMIFQIAPFG